GRTVIADVPPAVAVRVRLDGAGDETDVRDHGAIVLGIPHQVRVGVEVEVRARNGDRVRLPVAREAGAPFATDVRARDEIVEDGPGCRDLAVREGADGCLRDERDHARVPRAVHAVPGSPTDVG